MSLARISQPWWEWSQLLLTTLFFGPHFVDEIIQKERTKRTFSWFLASKLDHPIFWVKIDDIDDTYWYLLKKVAEVRLFCKVGFPVVTTQNSFLQKSSFQTIKVWSSSPFYKSQSLTFFSFLQKSSSFLQKESVFLDEDEDANMGTIPTWEASWTHEPSNL